jgi:hypothetical protein
MIGIKTTSFVCSSFGFMPLGDWPSPLAVPLADKGTKGEGPKFSYYFVQSIGGKLVFLAESRLLSLVVPLADTLADTKGSTGSVTSTGVKTNYFLW